MQVRTWKITMQLDTVITAPTEEVALQTAQDRYEEAYSLSAEDITDENYPEKEE